MRSSAVVPILLVLLFLVAACTPPPAPGASSLPPTPESLKATALPKATAGQAWEAEWQRTVAAAKVEGKVVIHTGLTPVVRGALTPAFKEKYGIGVEFLAGRAAELSQKLFAERRAGLYLVDLYLRGTTTALAELKPAGVLDPLEPLLILPEVLDPKVWWGEKLRWGDKAHYMLTFLAFPSGKMGINTTLVKPGEIKAWRDLLDPKWKGKISMNDPTVSGTGYRWFHTMARFILSPEYMRELVKQDPVIIRDQRIQVEWLARGKYPVAITPERGIMTEFRNAGAPVEERILAEGGYLTTGTGGIGVINKAPHPNASKVFVNWLLTREAQIIVSRAYGAQSARVDVPTDFLDRWEIRESGVRYIDVMDEEFDLKSEEYLKLAKEIFGPLAR